MNTNQIVPKFSLRIFYLKSKNISMLLLKILLIISLGYFSYTWLLMTFLQGLSWTPVPTRVATLLQSTKLNKKP